MSKKNSFSTRWLLLPAISLLLCISNAHAVDVPPELLQQLTELTKRVQQLEKRVAQQDQQLAAQQRAIAAQPVVAQNTHVDALEQRMLILERQQQLMAYETAEQKKKAPVLVAGDKGFGMRSADGKSELMLHGLVQADMRSFESNHKTDNNFLLRRARTTLEGKFNDTYGFKLTTDFGNGITGSGHLVDAYLDANYDPAFNIRVGKMTPGLSLYRLQGSSSPKFVESGLSSNFLPSRDQGVQISGDIFNKTLNYSVGLFNGANDGASGSEDSNTDKEINARLFASPFVNTSGALKGLGFGVGISQTDARGGNGSTSLASYKTFGQDTFFSYRKDVSVNDTVFADGERTRLVPQFSYYNGSFGLTGEYVLENQDITRVTGPGLRRTAALDNSGWDLTASYVLTGEKASGKNVKPAKPFDPANGGWGAWELALNVGQLNMDSEAFRGSNGLLNSADSFATSTSAAEQARNYALGVNWYLNNVLRVSMDYSDTAFDGGGGGTVASPDDRDNERVLTGRVQLSF